MEGTNVRLDLPTEYYDVTYKDLKHPRAGGFKSEKNMGGFPKVKFSERLKEANGEKTDLLDEIIKLLKRLLDTLLCCLTGGCYDRTQNGKMPMYDSQLMDEEKQAVLSLVIYLDSEKSKVPTINDSRLRALCIIIYSDNVQLQRSAAFCFSEFSNRMKSPVSEIVFEPLLFLLRTRDRRVQNDASLAISNFILNGPESNKEALVRRGAIKLFVELLQSDNVDIQYNIGRCITAIATSEKNNQSIVTCGGVKPLLSLVQSPDIRVRRNSSGTLLNLTRLQSCRPELVRAGALPVLVEVLETPDHEVQYYCAASLNNVAIDDHHRALILGIGDNEAIRKLIRLMNSRSEKVKCQVCLALRNLSTHADTQVLIVKLDGLPVLHRVIQTAGGETLVAALACLHNLSIPKQNEAGIIAETFLSELKRLVTEPSNAATQAHAAGIIGNLAAGDQVQKISASGCLESLVRVLLSKYTRAAVLVEVTSALNKFACLDENQERLLNHGEGEVLPRLVVLAASAQDPEIQYNCAAIISHLALTDIPVELLGRCMWGMLIYLQSFVTSSEQSFRYMALWTCVQLLKYPMFCSEVKGHTLLHAVERIVTSEPESTCSDEAEKVLAKVNSDS